MSTSEIHWPFDILGIDKIPTDKRAVKRAYAKRLKQIDQATEPQAFQDLRQAYEYALREVDYDTPTIPTHLPLPDVAPHPEAPPRSQEINTSTETDDWARVQELCSQIPNSTITEKNIDRLRRIFNDPVFQDIQSAQMLEQAVFDYVASKLQYVERHAEFAPQINHDILQLLDNRFGWYSDSVAFQKRFFVSPEFMSAMASQLGPTGEFEPPKHRFILRFAKVTAFLGAPVVWVGWAVTTFVLSITLPKPIAATVVGAMILIPIAIFILMFGGAFMILVLFPIVRIAKRLYYYFHNHIGRK